MYEEYQIEIPQSLMALFIEPGRQQPNASRAVVAARVELCVDMRGQDFPEALPDRDMA